MFYMSIATGLRLVSATIGPMTDEPAQDTPEPPTPPAPPSEPSGVGGPSLILIAGLATVLILVASVGALLVFNLGPFAQPTPTRAGQPSPTFPLATPSPQASATSASTATPGASATASAGPTATPIPSGDFIAVLLSHIPSEIVGSCTTTTGEGKVHARAKCSARDGNIEVTYLLYTDRDSMFATYDGFRDASQIEPNSGNCNNPQTWPAEGDFAISGEPSGRFLCTDALGATTIYWTDNRLNILSQATDTESDHDRLVDFWVHDSGPNP